jgi:site-specific DNA-methyltransferase (adenine-specific)
LLYDFIFMDPPFNIGHGYSNYADNIPWAQFCDLINGAVATAWAHLKPNGIMALHGPDSLADLYCALSMGMGFISNRVAWVNWHYRFGQNIKTNWPQTRCHCLVYAKNPDNYTWNPKEVLVPSDRAAVYGDKRTQASETPGLRLPGTVWGVPSDGPFWGRVTGNSEERQENRPNQLPEVYLERLLRAYTNPGHIVSDFFSGTGTTGTVAVALGRHFVGVDVDPEAREVSLARIRKGPVRIKGTAE